MFTLCGGPGDRIAFRDVRRMGRDITPIKFSRSLGRLLDGRMPMVDFAPRLSSDPFDTAGTLGRDPISPRMVSQESLPLFASRLSHGKLTSKNDWN